MNDNTTAQLHMDLLHANRALTRLQTALTTGTDTAQQLELAKRAAAKVADALTTLEN